MCEQPFSTSHEEIMLVDVEDAVELLSPQLKAVLEVRLLSLVGDVLK